MRALWRWYRSRRARTRWGLGLAALLAGLTALGALAPAPHEKDGGSRPATTPAASVPRATTTAAGGAPATHRATSTAHRDPEPTTSIAAAATPRGSRRSAQAALDALPVKGRAPKTGYSREQFGDGWATVAGCDMRDRILRRDLRGKVFATGGRCEVLRGRLDDPYTATAVRFVRGGAPDVDIDHVVALGDAWQKGAQQWSAARRKRFANDPLNLLAVDADTNRAKGDGDAATWLPPNRRFRCDYVARQVAVKRRYAAWVTRAEHDAIARVLARCPGQTLPRAGRVRLPSGAIRPGAMAPAPVPHPPSRERSPPGSGRVFRNCAAVRAAGLAPLRRGTKDYAANPGFDRDQDGLACER
jgi:hypothetical protein